MLFRESANTDLRELMEEKNVSLQDVAKQYHVSLEFLRVSLEKELPTSSKRDFRNTIEKCAQINYRKEMQKIEWMTDEQLQEYLQQKELREQLKRQKRNDPSRHQ